MIRSRRLQPVGFLGTVAALALLGCAVSGSPVAEGTDSPPSPTASVPATATAVAATTTATAALPDDTVVASTASIPTEDLPLVRFVAASGVEALLPVEVPPREEHTIGLSGRRSLEGRGMLFYYPGGDHLGGFWMKDTHIDLDIAFVDRDLRVIEVRRMTAESLDVHQPSRPYLAAIEAPADWYAERGIEAGARVEFLFDVEAVLAGR